MYRRFWILATLIVSPSLWAMPSVSGNTISWPDDGWYQVQNAQTYESLCQGGRSCEVPAGEYIVINHSTKKRYTGIRVGGSNGGDSSTPAEVTVNGNTISWPDDGWYQVQNAQTYESLCQGGRSCEVPAGEYIVINHSTKKRYTGIRVGGSNGGDSSTPAEVTVNGNTISWPDDGWYQVQNAQTYESLCQGGRSCEVPAGEYIVINHSTKKRYTGIRVGSSNGDDILPGSLRDELTQVFEVINGEPFRELANFADQVERYNGTTVSEFTYLRDIPPSAEQQAAGIDKTQYFACPVEGTVKKDRTISTSLGELYRYESCQWGDYTLSGNLKGMYPYPEYLYVSSDLFAFTWTCPGVCTLKVSSTNRTYTFQNARIVTDPLQSTESVDAFQSSWKADSLTVQSGSQEVLKIRNIDVADWDADAYYKRGLFAFRADVEQIDSLFGTYQVTTETLFPRNKALTENPSSGVMNITRPGLEMTLDADSGDPATFRLDVSESGSRSSYLVNWSDELRFRRFDLDPVPLKLFHYSSPEEAQ